jgi:microcystin-dependent protein
MAEDNFEGEPYYIKKGLPLSAAGVNAALLSIRKQSLLPIGTILMYDGTGWKDNETLKGWYKCDGYNGTPNLQDKFIKGQGSKAATGNGMMTLEIKHLPAHNHTIQSGGEHSHSYSSFEHSHLTNSDAPIDNAVYRWKNTSKNTTSAGGHTHTIGNTGNGQAFDVLPNYYSVIYIKRVA